MAVGVAGPAHGVQGVGGMWVFLFFFQAEDGIRDLTVTGVQTCALPIYASASVSPDPFLFPDYGDTLALAFQKEAELFFDSIVREDRPTADLLTADYTFVNEIGRASCRERV